MKPWPALSLAACCSCSPALPMSPGAAPQACSHFARTIGEAKLYGNVVRIQAAGEFTTVEVRNDLQLSPIYVTTKGEHHFIQPGHERSWRADSRFVAVSQSLLSYVPGKVTLKATVCR